MNMNVLKCAVVGMGLLGSRHAQFLLEYEKTELVSVCDIIEDKSKSFGERYGIKAYNQVKEMVAKENIDVLIVATQDPYHKEPVLEACAADIPYIISEKPLATSAEDALEMIEAAKRSETKLYVLFPNRFYPLDNAIRTVVQNNYLGTPKHGEMRIDNSLAVPKSLWGKDNNVFAKHSSPLYFLVSHAVDLLRYYFEPREIVKVYAVGKQGTVGSVVDYMDALLTFSDGMTFRLKSEWTKHMNSLVEFYVQLTGTEGGFVYNKTPGFGSRSGLRLDMASGEEQVKALQNLLNANEVNSRMVVHTGEYCKHALEMYPEEGNDFVWDDGIGKYINAIIDRNSSAYSIADATDGYKQVLVVEALLTSIMTNKEIELNY